ncbi:glycosyltransferase family 4 protein [Kitasatospora kifunensis]|uniref:Glycosyltransferase involved in cell wall biosynthesis n=1 Tax=Kitasatospora kifunensis TaxID=58351 RepID=A0A7W7R6M6_KITKI|nr:glycosyltransferase family 4 protein [Kitasatospora kifunensis]MBB4926285.1 glycosyltransferase involved in cell wall biosynthesis [Kitasatospora kifunensis]
MSTILQITPYYPPHLGGLERVVENLAAGLGDRHEVQVLTTTIGADGAPRRTRQGAVTVRRHRSVEFAHTPLVPGLPLALLRQPLRSPLRSPTRSPTRSPLRSPIRRPNDTVLHLHSAHALLPELVALAARLRRQPFVLHFHLDVDASGRFGRLLPAYKKHVFGPVLRAAAAVIVLTPSQADFVRTTYRVPGERIHVVPNGVDRAYFMPVREVREPVERPLELLYVGRLSPQKNVGRLLEAIHLLHRPVRLRIVGDGELRGQLEAQAAELGLTQVEFAGAKLGPDLVRAYAEADAFVLPSDKEGMPLVALEAMAAGLPVIATDVPGNTELLSGIGLLAAPEPTALAAAIDEVAGDAQLRRRLAERSAEAAPAFAWDAVVRRVERVYAEVLG